MASITPSALVGSISGKIGSTVFSKSSAGLTVRSAQRTIKHTSPQALQAKALMMTAHSVWPTLSADRYATWAAAASSSSHTNRLGVSRPMTPHDLFMYQQLISLTAVSDTYTVPHNQRYKYSVGSISLTFTAGGTYYVPVSYTHLTLPTILLV